MAQAPQTTPTTMMSQTPSVFNQNAGQKFSFGNGISINQNPSITASNALKNAGYTNTLGSPLKNISLSDAQKTNPNLYTKQELKNIAKTQKATLKAEQNALKQATNQNLTPEQKDDRARNIAGWTLAGIDSAVNIANAGMSYANMAKQWEMQNKMYELAAQQQQDEKDRYNKREEERLKARDEAQSAQRAVFGNREWHDPSANQNAGESSEGNQNAEQEKTAFERD